MKYLIFYGTASVGKTTVIKKFANWLVKFKGYTALPALSSRDILSVLKKDNKEIIINSASDTIQIIKDLSIFCNKHSGYDMIITSCRENEMGNLLKNELFAQLKITNNDEVIEIPMAKINDKSTTYNGVKRRRDEYCVRILRLAKYIFKSFYDNCIIP